MTAPAHPSAGRVDCALGPARSAGLTLVEVLGATVVLALAVVSSAWVLSHATSTRATMQTDPVSAVLLATQIHELAVSLSPEPSGSGPAHRPAEVVALDNLDGAVFSPPIDADLGLIPDSTGWAQQVFIGTKNPTTAAGLADYAYPDPHGDAMVRLTVTITHMGAHKGTYVWWLEP